MDRLRRAVEMARQEQAQSPASGVSQPASVPADLALQVRYTRTRVHPIGADVLRERRVIAGRGRDPVTLAYKLLRTRVLQMMLANGWKSLAVTSPGAGDGKSLTAVNLAISLAQEVHHSVLLVDADLPSPSLHRHFDYEPALGLGDYLTRDAPLDSILFNPGIDRLVVLPARQVSENASELLASPRMARLVAELASRYPSRLIVFDLPPLLCGDEVLSFSPHVDAALLVVREGRTRRDQVRQALAMLDGVNVLGTVLNGASPARTAGTG